MITPDGLSHPPVRIASAAAFGTTRQIGRVAVRVRLGLPDGDEHPAPSVAGARTGGAVDRRREPLPGALAA